MNMNDLKTSVIFRAGVIKTPIFFRTRPLILIINISPRSTQNGSEP